MKKLCANFRNIIWLCKPIWKYGKLYLFLSVFITVIRAPIEDYIYVRFPQAIIQALSNNSSFVQIIIIASIFCAISLFFHILPYFFHGYFAKNQERIDLRIKQDVYEKAQQIDYKYIDSPEYYDNYAWAINEYANQTNSAKKFIGKFFSYLFSISVLIAIVSIIGPWILLIEAIQLTLQIAINNYTNKIGIKKKDELIPINRKLSYYHRLFYLKDYCADLKTTLLSQYVFIGYKETGEKKVKITTKYAKRIGKCIILQECIFCITELVIILYLVKSIISGQIPQIGMYMTMILAFYRVDSKLYGFVDMLKEVHSISLNAEKIRQFFSIQSTIEVQGTNETIVPAEKSFSVNLQNVSFKYDNSDFALDNINLVIKPGEKIAIVGENGAGKTTLVKLLLRLYDVTEGEIRINNIPIKEYNVHRLREKIGVAFQNTNIYAMSLLDNTSLYNKIGPSDFQIVSERVGLNTLLEKNNTNASVELTREFDKNGIVLSGGEAQRVALARIMSQDFGLLLLDEASSALDPIAEYKMSKLIIGEANKTTTIIIAHRLSTIREANRIILIEHGRISEIGTHDELIKKRGKYFEMFTKQAENYKD